MKINKKLRLTPDAENLLNSIPANVKLFFIELLKLLCGLAANPQLLQITNSDGEVIPQQQMKEICAGNNRTLNLRVGPKGKLKGHVFFIIKKYFCERNESLNDVLNKHLGAAFCVSHGLFTNVYYIVDGGVEELFALKKLVADNDESKSYRFSRTLPIQIGTVHLENIPEPINYYRMASLLQLKKWLPIQDFKVRAQHIKIVSEKMMPTWFYNAVVNSAGHNKSIDYCWAGFIGIFGALLAKKLKVVLEDNNTQGLAPNLWVCLYGDPGSGKTPVIEWILSLVQKYTADPKSSNDVASRMLFDNAIASIKAAEFKKYVKEATENFQALNQVIMSKEVSRKFKIEESQAIEYKGKLAITTDTTAAGLTDLLQINELSVLLIADELKTLLRILGSKENTKLRGQLLQAESSNSFMMVTRATQTSKSSTNATISLLGGIQPDAIATFIAEALQGNESNDGLINRFLLLVKNVTKNSSDEFTDSTNNKRVLVKFLRAIFRESFEFIDQVDGQYSVVRFSDEAQNLFQSWQRYNVNKIDNAPNKLLINQFNKYVGLVARLSLIYQTINSFNPDFKSIDEFKFIEKNALLYAIKSVEYLRSHAESIFSSEDSLLHTESTFVMKRLIETGLNNFTPSQLAQKDWRYIKRDPDKTLQILLYLESFGLVRSKAEIRKTIWQVNPIAKLSFK